MTETRKSSLIKVIHTANDDCFNIAGATVASVKALLRDPFNIPADAIAEVNGRFVEPSYRLKSGELLEFVLRRGRKSILDPEENAKLDRIEAMLKKLLEKSSNGDHRQIPTRQSRLQVDEKENSVILDNNRLVMDEKFVAIIACLHDANGAWVSGLEMAQRKKCLEFEDRIDRLIAKLKKQYPKIGILIESNAGRGFRLILA